jgi:hypothetical protein
MGVLSRIPELHDMTSLDYYAIEDLLTGDRRAANWLPLGNAPLTPALFGSISCSIRSGMIRASRNSPSSPRRNN